MGYSSFVTSDSNSVITVNLLVVVLGSIRSGNKKEWLKRRHHMRNNIAIFLTINGNLLGCSATFLVILRQRLFFKCLFLFNQIRCTRDLLLFTCQKIKTIIEICSDGKPLPTPRPSSVLIRLDFVSNLYSSRAMKTGLDSRTVFIVIH